MIFLISLIITKTIACFVTCVENYNSLIKILTVFNAACVRYGGWTSHLSD